MDVDIRILCTQDAEKFWNLRLEALEQEPLAFGSSAEEHRSTTLELAATRISPPNSHNFVFGAFIDGELVGTVGLARHQNLKDRHKARIWGVYVQKKHRGKGIARRLLMSVLERARSQPGLEQVMLTVGQQQTAAKRLYSSLGFEIFGHEHHALKIGEQYVDEDYMVFHFRSQPSSLRKRDR